MVRPAGLVMLLSFMREHGLPALPPAPHHHDDLCVSFWRYAKPVGDAVPDAAEAGRMLAELHGALRAYPGELPLLAPPLSDIPRGLERL